MATAKQQEEKRIKNLRRMVALPHNRNCFDCGQRGPTYVNMTVGAYVCTACSGIVRGLNPPHRVKSVSMGSFTQEEIDTLTERGNEYNREVWLAHHDTKLPPEFDTKDEMKLRDYMIQKYERKRWHAPASPGLADKAKQLNSQSTNSSNASTTSVRRPVAGAFKMPGPPGALPKVQVPLPTNNTTAPPVSATVAAPVSSQAAPSTDLLSDVFSSSSTTTAQPNSNNFTQPDFANFSGASIPAAAPVSATSAQKSTTPSLFPTDNNPMDSLTGPLDTGPAGNTSTLVDTVTAGAGQPVAAPAHNSNQWSTLSADPNQGSDKYASLTGLFANTANSGPGPGTQASALSSNPPAAATGVNWNSINWGASSDSSSQGQGQGMSWGGSDSTGTQPQVTGGATGGGVFGQPPVSSIQPNSTASGWGANVPSTGVNPFLVSSSVTQPQVGGFGQVGQAGVAPSYPGSQTTGASFGAFSTTQASMTAAPQTQLSSGFPYQQSQQPNPFSSGVPQAGTGFSSFPPNATSGVPHVAGGFPAGSAGFPAQNGATKQWGAPPQQPAQQWGSQNQWGGGGVASTQWSAGPVKPAANPFLVQAPQGAVGQPSSTVTNPFL